MVHEVIRRGTLAVCLLGALALGACGSDDMDGDGTNEEGQKAECSSKMFDKYGAPAFVAVRDSIVAKALAAPTDKLGDSFQNFAGSASAGQLQAFQDNL